MVAAANAPEQRSEQQEIVVRLLGFQGQLQRFGDQGMQVRLEHFFILGCQHRDGSEHQLEKLQIQVGALNV